MNKLPRLPPMKDMALDFVGNYFRKTFAASRLPPVEVVQLAYYDAMTYNRATNSGGARFCFRFRDFRRYHLRTAQELLYRHSREIDPKIPPSTADFLQFAAVIAVREMGGPELYKLIVHGRKDAENEHEAGSPDNIPQNSNSAADFEAKFLDKGFSIEQAVALSAIEAFPTIKKPLRDKSWSIF